MKEATGELNGTLIVVMAIAALSAFFFTVIWPLIRQNLVIEMSGGNKGMVYCHAPNNKNDVIYCPYRG